MLTAAAAQGRTGSVIEIGALRALALAACGDQDAAADALTRALALGGPQGYVRVFADEGAPMRALLARLSRPSWASEPPAATSTPATWPGSCAPAMRRATRPPAAGPPHRPA